MTTSKRIRLTVILWALIGNLCITNACWAEESIIYYVRGDAVYTIRPNDTNPIKLVEGDAARPSPDGRLLAIWRQSQGIYILSIDSGRRIKRIAIKAPLFFDFAWSPDNRWIAYAGEIEVGRQLFRKSEIFLISVQNRSIRQLTFHHGRKRRLVWAPDSRSIFYGETGASRSKYWEVGIQKPEKPKEYNLFHKGASFIGTIGAFFSFSNDGDEIAYGSVEDNGGVYIASANGTNHQKLTPAGSYRTYRVAWSPNDDKIAFFSYYHETGTSVLYTVSRHNSKIQRLIEIPHIAYGLTWVDTSAFAIESAEKLTTTWGKLKR